MSLALSRSRRSIRQALAGFAFANPVYQLSLSCRTPAELAQVPADPWPGNAARGADLCAGVYDFSGEVLKSDRPVWKPVGVGSGWMAELHGFEWLRDLRALGGDKARAEARKLVTDWMNRHSRWSDTVWRGDVLGSRICNWIAMHDFYCASAGDGFRARVFNSLNRQAKHLSRITPGTLDGYPLLLAIKGLAYAGICLPGGMGRLHQAMKLLPRALPAQILQDGTHVTRNPEMVLHALRHLIDLRALLVAARIEVPSVLQHSIDRMTPALRFFRHGDGKLALFNGSSEADSVLIEAVLAQSDVGGRAMRSAPHSGFERVVAGRALLLLDAGTAPDPGHDLMAHAGALGFEFSLGRDRVIVNCGAQDGRGELASALRATAAHSTVTLGDINSASIRRDGRIGRCPDPIRVQRSEEDGATLIDAEHNGYRPVNGCTHRRRLFLAANGDDLRGEDSITGKAGVDFALRLHLHPAVSVSMTQGGSVLLRLQNGVGWKFVARGGETQVEDSLYAPQRSLAPRRSRQIVIYGKTGENGALVKWALRREKK